MPPNPSNVRSEYVTESGVHIFYYTNGAVHLLRDREDPDSGVWLDNIDKQELHGTLEECNQWGPSAVEEVDDAG